MHNEALVKSLGATHIIDRNADVFAEVKKIVSSPVEIIFDTISEKATQELAWEILAPGGTLLLVIEPQVDRTKYPNKHIEYFIANFHVGNRELGVSLYSKLAQLFGEGVLKVCPSV